MKSNRIMWGFVSLLVLITVAVSFGAFESSGREDSSPQSKVTPTETPWPVIKDTRDLSKYGSVDYSKAPEDLSAARMLANKRYDDQGTWVFKSVHPVTAGVGRIRDDEPPPLFPTEESALVVLGEIMAAKAYLSNDKGYVYTEFTIRVEELLKKGDSRKTGPKNVIADREGGVVVYPGDQRVLYQDSALGLPRLGSKYLFFLKKDDESPNYAIITSYDVTDTRVRQVEMGRNFDEFKDSDKTAFLEKVRNRIARPPN